MYTDKVELTVLVPDDEEGFLMKELMEGTNGQAMTEKTEQCWFAETEEGIKILNNKRTLLTGDSLPVSSVPYLYRQRAKPGFAK